MLLLIFSPETCVCFVRCFFRKMKKMRPAQTTFLTRLTTNKKKKKRVSFNRGNMDMPSYKKKGYHSLILFSPYLEIKSFHFLKILSRRRSLLRSVSGTIGINVPDGLDDLRKSFVSLYCRLQNEWFTFQRWWFIRWSSWRIQRPTRGFEAI